MKILLAILLLIPVGLFAKEPTTEPILRLNTGMHTATLRRVSTDAGGTLLLTAADDKTAMLWDIRSGEKLQVFRPPLDFGNEGKLFACALSPAGNIAAVGGWTGWDWYGNSSIYLFDTRSGEMIRRISGLESGIDDLEFSPDGKYLAACMGGGFGVKVFNTGDWSQKVLLSGYGDVSYNAAFDKNGRMITVCWDGKLRLYDSAFKLIKETTTSGGIHPFSVAFSPDGKKIAVGYDDTTRLQVLDSSTLKVIFEPDVKGLKDDRRLEMVCWSADGKYLYAGGMYLLWMNDSWWFVIRKYQDGGRGGFTDFPACRSTVMDVKPLPDGTVVYGGAFPDLGRLDTNGKQVFYRNGEINDVSAEDKTHFRLSDDGSIVGFSPLNRSPLTFSLKERELAVKAASYPTYRDSGKKISISNWYYSYSPLLNGQPMKFLQTYEHSQSVDISQDETSIIVGGDWNIYCLDDKGKIRWQVPGPGIPWAIKISGNGKVACAAFGEGTIRWYRLSDGKELLTLFVHADAKHWVLWTESGYYDASPGGQDLIGWHINNGSDRAADFYPASRFENRFYRPDITALLLETLDEKQALAQADKKKDTVTKQVSVTEILPPIVRILNPASGQSFDQSRVTLELLIKTQADSPVEEIKVMINGRPSDNTVRGLSIVARNKDGVNKSIDVELEEGENTVSVLARNKNGYSEAASATLTYKKPKPATGGDSEEFVIKPKLYVLAVGVSNYKKPDIRLKFPAKDAKDFAAAMQKQQGKLYREVVIKTLVDADATRDNILDGLQWLQTETTSMDVAMLFIAGHGMTDNNGRLYYLPQEADPENLKRTALPTDEISATLGSISGKAICFMDTCHSGVLKVSRRGGDLDMNAVINELSSAENGSIVYTSSSGKQYSLESSDWNNGAFTKALVDGLNGKADYTGDGQITVNELGLFIAENVKKLTKGVQTPVLGKPDMMRDFALAVN